MGGGGGGEGDGDEVGLGLRGGDEAVVESEADVGDGETFAFSTVTREDKGGVCGGKEESRRVLGEGVMIGMEKEHHSSTEMEDVVLVVMDEATG